MNPPLPGARLPDVEPCDWLWLHYSEWCRQVHQCISAVATEFTQDHPFLDFLLAFLITTSITSL